MFHAGLVTPSWSLLLQLDTFGDPTLSLVGVGLFVGLQRPDPESPVRAGSMLDREPYVEEVLLTLDIPRSLSGVVGPVLCGLMVAPLALGPMGDGKAEGLTEWAAREKAPRHWST